MDHNPFYDAAKADAHSPHDVASLFVPDASPIWRDLQYPINHLVVGARGTGKTMALRQLDYLTLASGDQKPDFVGVYTHVSRISAIFHALFADPERSADQSLVRQFQQVFADYLALEIVRGLCDLADADARLARPDCSAVFRLPGGFDAGDIANNCTRLQIQVESSIQVLADLGSMCMAAARRPPDYRRPAREGPAARQFVARAEQAVPLRPS